MASPLKSNASRGRYSPMRWAIPAWDRCQWEVRRAIRSLLRRGGVLGIYLPILATVGLLAWFFEQGQLGEVQRLQQQSLDRSRLPVRLVASPVADERAKLGKFDEFLLPHDQIPDTIKKILLLAEEEHLQIIRGEYQPQADERGGFLRYRMSLPLKGETRSIYRFMQRVLMSQPALALENVSFKRERIESAEVEARLQCALFVRYPDKASPTPTRKGVDQ